MNDYSVLLPNDYVDVLVSGEYCI